jgi:hypothetical protein
MFLGNNGTQSEKCSVIKVACISYMYKGTDSEFFCCLRRRDLSLSAIPAHY